MSETDDYTCTPREHRRLVDQLQRAAMGPDRSDILQWIAEILIESRPAGTGESITIEDAATAIADWLQPIGGFNGGGTICVLSAPDHWLYPELATSGYRKLRERYPR